MIISLEEALKLDPDATQDADAIQEACDCCLPISKIAYDKKTAAKIILRQSNLTIKTSFFVSAPH
jgi:hypothetical protein